MELKKFIQDTLTNIYSGVQDANKQLNEDKPKFNMKKGEDILFDIAVTVTEGDTKKGGGGIKIYAVEIGAKKEKTSVNANVSRIKFKITSDGNIR